MRNAIKAIHEKSYYSVLESPVGRLTVVASDQGVRAIFWQDAAKPLERNLGFGSILKAPDHPLCALVSSQLDEYFRGARKTFEIPLIPEGTRFQIAAWNRLSEIPYGQTISYEEQAIRLGGKEKVRAVGRANGMNPIPILIPCHRVIGKNGSLTGFGGGLAIKSFLLNLESGQPREAIRTESSAKPVIDWIDGRY